MRECDNSKIHISSNFLSSICHIIMLDTLLVPPLHCNTSLHNNNNNNNYYYYYYYYFVVVSCHRPFLPGTSREPTAIPTDQASSFRLQYFPYYV